MSRRNAAHEQQSSTLLDDAVLKVLERDGDRFPIIRYCHLVRHVPMPEGQSD